MSESIKNIIFREANLNDLKALCICGKALLQYEHKFDETIDIYWLEEKEGGGFLRERIKDENGIVLLAESDAKIIGYLAGGLVEPEPFRNLPANAVMELEEIFVDNNFRGHDIGGKLLAAFVDWAKTRGASKMKVVVSASNQGAIGFYKRMFFKEYDLILERELR